MSPRSLRILLLAAVLPLGACAVVPAGGYYDATYYGGGYAVVPPPVVVPAPAVVVRPAPVLRPWSGVHRHDRGAHGWRRDGRWSGHR